MNSVLRSFVVAVTVLASSAAFAGGPVIIEEGNDELIVEKPRSAGIFPIIGILVLACLVACGGGDDDEDDKKP